jgi:ligand-binding SRPBCC domain-containing protein
LRGECDDAAHVDAYASGGRALRQNGEPTVKLERITFVPASLEEVFAFFSDSQNLALITPPRTRFRVVAGPLRPLREGDRVEYRLRVFGFPIRWRSHISMWRDREAFADRQESGPFRRWLHTHSFRAVPGGVEMRDEVEYDLPLGLLGRLLGGWMVRRELERIFDYRGEAIRRRFGERASRPPAAARPVPR